MAATPAQRNQIAIAFGAVLRAARTRSGLSQEALGLACDIDRTYVSLLERGERQPTLSTLYCPLGASGGNPGVARRSDRQGRSPLRAGWKGNG